MDKTPSVFWQCVTGPKLYQIYPNSLPRDEQLAHLYRKNISEIVSDSVLLCLKMSFEICRTIWPLCLWYYYQTDSFTYENGISFLENAICISIIGIYFMLIRGLIDSCSLQFFDTAEILLRI
ncbi:unnamed protein product [Adineta ricciae]|uniref:Phosphatidylserine Lipase ABHD16 N-terminal domain-containing protein n=1 Tax=Adineta ricciae TaxID=249248 RepID=A0A816HC56_ADIRI|nr:unnamed protein product [Adineta ricciae]